MHKAMYTKTRLLDNGLYHSNYKEASFQFEAYIKECQVRNIYPFF